MKSLCYGLFGLILSCLFSIGAAAQTDWEVGAGIHDITGPAGDTFLVGYGVGKKSEGIQTRLWSRAFVIKEASSDDRIVFVSTDLHSIPTEVKFAVVDRLQRKYGEFYTLSNVMLTATHTHTGPGGFHSGLVMQSATSGADLSNFEVIVSGITQSILEAHDNLELATIEIGRDTVSNANINRSLQAHNQNANVNPAETVNRTMTLLKFTSFNTGKPIGTVNWFAVHNVSLQDSQRQISSDNKGFASYLFEKTEGTNYTAPKTFVAAFANSNLGDASPNVCGPVNGCRWVPFESTFESAGKQYRAARKLFDNPTRKLTGDLDYRAKFVFMPFFTVSDAYAYQGNSATLCRQSYGASFQAGAGFDGPTGDSSEGLTSNAHPCHAPKRILFVPPSTYENAIPFQLFKIGDFVIIAVAGEMTTMSGRLLEQNVRDILKVNQADLTTVVAGLANSYHGYITTPEEYNVQRYEGAHTVFGPNTHGAYMQIYADMAAKMADGDPVSLGAPVVLRNMTHSASNSLIDDGVNGQFGDVIQDARASYFTKEKVEVSFKAGSPRNDYMTDGSFLEVQRQVNGSWEFYANDNDLSTEFHWRRHAAIQVPPIVNTIIHLIKGIFGISNGGSGIPNMLQSLSRSTATIKWQTDKTVPTGNYRIVHYGYSKPPGGVPQFYRGVSREFMVINPNHTVNLQALQTPNFLSADQNGGGNVNSDATWADSWETFMLFKDESTFQLSQTSTCIQNNNQVGLITRDRSFLSVPDTAEDLRADQSHFKAWEQFTIRFNATQPGPCLKNGDEIDLETRFGRFVQKNGSGADARGTAAGPRFRVSDLKEWEVMDVALKAPNGDYLTAVKEGGEHISIEPPAGASGPDKTQLFTIAVLNETNPTVCSGARVGLKTSRDFYLARQSTGILSATDVLLNEAATLTLRLDSAGSQPSCLQSGSSFNGDAYIEVSNGIFLENTPSQLGSSWAPYRHATANSSVQDSQTRWIIEAQ